MNIKAFFEKNKLIKSIALIIAIFMWLNAMLSRDVQIEKTADIILRNIPDSLVITSMNQLETEIILEGKSMEFILMKLFRKKVIVEINLNDFNIEPNENLIINIDNSMIKIPLSDEDINILRIKEKAIILSMDSLRTKDVPVVPVLENNPANGYARSGEIIYKPEKVKITGGKSLIEKIFHIETSSINLENATKNFSEKALIKHNYQFITVEPKVINVTIPVDKLMKRRFDSVPVELLNVPSKYSISPDSMYLAVEIEGPEAIVKNLFAGELAPLIDVSNIKKKGIYKYPMNLGYKNIKVLSVIPDTLEIIAE